MLHYVQVEVQPHGTTGYPAKGTNPPHQNLGHAIPPGMWAYTPAKIYPRKFGKVPIPMLRDTPSVVGAGVTKPRPITPDGGRGRLYVIPKGMYGGAPSVMHRNRAIHADRVAYTSSH